MFMFLHLIFRISNTEDYSIFKVQATFKIYSRLRFIQYLRLFSVQDLLLSVLNESAMNPG